MYEENCGLEWKNWHRSFEWYLKANHIDNEDDKFLKLMHLAGRKVQELFATLPEPAPTDQIIHGPLAAGFVPHPSEYEKAMAKLNEFFEPKKNSTYERHMLRMIKQEKGEKIGLFAMRLRTQADKCDFGDSIESNIKDQIIEKCLSAKLRRDLLKLGDANLDKVLKTAKIFEAIQEQSKTFDQPNTNQSVMNENVNKIDSKTFKTNNLSKQIECSRCGYAGHRASDEKCPANGKTCNKCNGRNHFGRKCRSKRRFAGPNNKQINMKIDSGTNVHTKQETVEPQEPPQKKPTTNETIKLLEAYKSNIKDEYIFCIADASINTNEIECKIGGIPIAVVIDSGSKYNIIDVNAWEYLKANNVIVTNQRTDASHSFKAYGGHPLSIVGVFEANIQTAYKSCTADFYVLKDYGKVLIGYETGIPLGVLKIGENVNQITRTEQMSKIKDFVVDIPIKQDVKPVIQPYRRIPVPLEAAVDKKIDELEKMGIIEKV